MILISVEELLDYLFRRLDAAWDIFIFEDLPGEYVFDASVIDIFLTPRNTALVDLGRLRQVLRDLSVRYSTNVTNGLFSFRDKSVRCTDGEPSMSAVVLGTGESACGMRGLYAYQLARSKTCSADYSVASPGVEEYLYSEASGLMHARKFLISNLMNNQALAGAEKDGNCFADDEGAKLRFMQGCRYYLMSGVHYLAELDDRKPWSYTFPKEEDGYKTILTSALENANLASLIPLLFTDSFDAMSIPDAFDTTSEALDKLINALLKVETMRLGHGECELKFRLSSGQVLELQTKALGLGAKECGMRTEIDYIVLLSNTCHSGNERDSRMMLRLRHERAARGTEDVLVTLKLRNPSTYSLSNTELEYRVSEPDMDVRKTICRLLFGACGLSVKLTNLTTSLDSIRHVLNAAGLLSRTLCYRKLREYYRFANATVLFDSFTVAGLNYLELEAPDERVLHQLANALEIDPLSADRRNYAQILEDEGVDLRLRGGA